MESLLENLRSTTRSSLVHDYHKLESDCPPIPKQLLVYLDKMFARKAIDPTSPSMSTELIYRAGIDKVLDHLRRQNARQEGAARDLLTKES